MGLTVHMSCSGHWLTTGEAKSSRFVTKVRWAMEAAHGIVKQKYRIPDHRVDNSLLPKIPVLTRIAYFLSNTFAKRPESDLTMFGEVVRTDGANAKRPEYTSRGSRGESMEPSQEIMDPRNE